jgi:hypothetical protein
LTFIVTVLKFWLGDFDPSALKKEEVGMNSETRILCRICNQPVRLTSDIAVDEDGQAVHENCYVQKLASARPKWNPPADQNPEPQ